jgi:membrane-associated protease RseP (regulator of RpoE activity)
VPDAAWYAVGVLAFVVGLAVSIGLHEIGHLVPAKRYGVRVTQYMIGFGPTVWSKVRGETEYGIKAIPLGGYIRMIGMFPPADPARAASAQVPRHVAEADAAAAGVPVGRSGTSGIFTGLIEGARAQSLEEFRPGDEKRAFYALKVRQKLVIMLGGPVMNLLLGSLLIGGIVTMYGAAELTTRVDVVSRCVLPVDAPADAECGADDPAAPAAAAGIRPGDVILSVAGTATPTWEDVRTAIRDSGGRPVDVVVERDGGQQVLRATPIVADVPVLDADGAPVTEGGEPVLTRAGFLGVAPASEVVRQPVTAVPGLVADTVVDVAGILVRLPSHLAGVAEAAFGDAERDPNGPVSIVGVGRLSGEIAADGEELLGLDAAGRVAAFLGVLGSLNIALFVFNLVPLLPLDGGHAAGALWEGLRKAWARVRSLPEPPPVDVAKALPLAYGVAIVLLGMSALLIYADIVRPITLTG